MASCYHTAGEGNGWWMLNELTGRALSREVAAAALAEIFAGARALKELFGSGDLEHQLVQFGDFATRERLPSVGGSGVFSEAVKEAARFIECEAARFGALKDGEPFEGGGIVKAASANADRFGQDAGLLVVTDGRSRHSRLLRELTDGHEYKFT